MRRVKAALVVLLGLVLAAGMVTAGVWQFGVYQRQGAEAAAARAAEAPVPLSSVARAGAPVGDGYGRTVTFRGSYERQHQVLVPVAERPDTFRVVTLFRLENGDALAVVRGLSGQEPAPPPEPAGPVNQSGILLPSEEAAVPAAGAEIGSIRIAQLAQRWPGPLGRRFRGVERRERPGSGPHPRRGGAPRCPRPAAERGVRAAVVVLRGVHRGDGSADRP